MLVCEMATQYGEPKRHSKTLRISEEAAKYVTKEGERTVRSQIDQIDHLKKLHELVVRITIGWCTAVAVYFAAFVMCDGEPWRWLVALLIAGTERPEAAAPGARIGGQP